MKSEIYEKAQELRDKLNEIGAVESLIMNANTTTTIQLSKNMGEVIINTATLDEELKDRLLKCVMQYMNEYETEFENL